MKEKDFQKMVIELIKAQDGHATNVEPSLTNFGMPDINYCIAGIEANLELKIMGRGEAAPLVRPPQVRWFDDRVAAGGLPMLAYYIVYENGFDQVLVFQGRHVTKLALATDLDQIMAIPHLTVHNPAHLIEGLHSEMAAWHDEIHPPE